MVEHVWKQAARLTAAAAVLACALPIAQAQGTGTSTPPPPKKPWYESILFKGFVQFDAIFPEGNSTNGSVSNFRIRRARPTFVVGIDPLTKVQVQLDVSTPKANGGPATTSVTDTFVERQIPTFGYVSVGQQMIPFGREVLEDNAAIRSPLELSFPAEVLACSERDLGIFARSEHGAEAPYNWAVAVVNGQGWKTADANANKAFIGRVTARVHPWVRLGTSTLLGTYRAGSTDYDRKAQGYEIQVKPSRAAVLTGELYHAKFVDVPSAPTKPAYFEGGYLLLESWIGSIKSIPYFRYQRTYGDLDYRSYDFGWRWQYTPTQRVTVEYDLVKGHQRDFFGARWQLNF